MSIEFNLGDRTHTLVGNWRENRALEERGEKARVAGREAKKIHTGERVLPKTAGAGTWVSESVEASKAILAKAAASPMGPRARLQQRLVEQKADAYATALLTPAPDLLKFGSTTAAADYHPFPAEEYRVPVRRPGAVVETTRSASASRGAASGSAGIAASGAPVTFYTQRLVEGVYAKGPIKNARSPFAVSRAFSNPIQEGERLHAEATEITDPEAVTVLGKSTALLTGAGTAGASLDSRLPGASLALQRLFTRLLRRLAESPGAGPARAHACLAALFQDMRGAAAAYVGDLGRTASGIPLDDSHVLTESFRARMHALRVAMPDRDLEAAISACDDDCTGRVSVPLLLQVLLSTIPPARRERIAAVYDAAAAGGAARVATIPALAGRLRADAVPEVRAGQASATDVLNGFLSFFVELGAEEEVPEELFAVYLGPASACLDAEADFATYLREVWGAK